MNLHDRLTSTLMSYLDLPVDWDGYEGRPPSLQAIVDAIEFIDSLPEGAVLPKPMLAGTGEVELFIDTGGYYLDVGFQGDQTFSFYAEYPNGGEFGEDEVPISQFPEQLREFLVEVTTQIGGHTNGRNN
jgi:hypothetical protein